MFSQRYGFQTGGGGESYRNEPGSCIKYPSNSIFLLLRIPSSLSPANADELQERTGRGGSAFLMRTTRRRYNSKFTISEWRTNYQPLPALFFFFGKFDEFVFDEDEEIKIAMQREKKNVKILLKVLTDYFLFILVN